MKKPEVTPENSIELDGVIYTAEMRAEMKRWYACKWDSTPQQFVNQLVDIHEYFSRLLVDSSKEDDIWGIIGMMGTVIEIKDHMKIFIPKIEHE